VPDDNGLDKLFVEVPDEMAKQVEDATVVKPVDLKNLGAVYLNSVPTESWLTRTVEGLKNPPRADVPWLEDDEVKELSVSHRAMVREGKTAEAIARTCLSEEERARVYKVEVSPDPVRGNQIVRFYLKPGLSLTIDFTDNRNNRTVNRPLKGLEAEMLSFDEITRPTRALADGTPRPRWYDDPATEKQVGLLKRALVEDPMCSATWEEYEAVVGREFHNMEDLTKGEASNLITAAKEKRWMR
jgi:hypothetical protein